MKSKTIIENLIGIDSGPDEKETRFFVPEVTQRYNRLVSLWILALLVILPVAFIKILRFLFAFNFSVVCTALFAFEERWKQMWGTEWKLEKQSELEFKLNVCKDNIWIDIKFILTWSSFQGICPRCGNIYFEFCKYGRIVKRSHIEINASVSIFTSCMPR